MATITTKERLGAVRRRITHPGTKAEERTADDAVVERLPEPEGSGQLAGHRTAVEAATTEEQFTLALQAALDRWDAYLERLQIEAACKTGPARERAERAIVDLRQRRLLIGARVAAVGRAAGHDWREARAHALAGLDGLTCEAARCSQRSADDAGPDPDDEASTVAPAERLLAGLWKLVILRGLVAVLLGVVLLLWPGIGLTTLVVAVGVGAIASGCVSLAARWSLPHTGSRHRAWWALHAVLGLVGGAAVLLWPGLSAVALLYAIAVWAIGIGLVELVAAFVLPLTGPRRVLVALGGIALGAVGLAMFVDPVQGASAIVVLVAVFALLRGTSDIALGSQLRRPVGGFRGRLGWGPGRSGPPVGEGAVGASPTWTDGPSRSRSLRGVPVGASPEGGTLARRGPAAMPFGTRLNVRYGAAVYGSFLAASVVGLSFEAGRDVRAMTLTVGTSMLAFWLAHWWAEVLGAQISAGTAFRARDALTIAAREWPLVEAAVVPTLLLALAWLGAWSRDTGAALAMAAAIVQIVGWGLIAGRRAGGTWLHAVLFAVAEGMLGVGLLLLERLVR